MSAPAETYRRSPIEAAAGLRLRSGVTITDLTLRPRAGAKGQGLHGFLGAIGYSAGPTVNKAYRQSDGSLLALLSPSEVLWLGMQASEAAQRRWASPNGQALAQRIYSVPRKDGTYWFQLTGKGVVDGFSRLCSPDLRAKSFDDLTVAQTLVARSSAIVLRDDNVGEGAFHLIGDISLAPYMREVVTAAMTQL